MLYLQIIRKYSSKHSTWCFKQGYYQYDKFKKTNHYSPLICKFIDVPAANKEFSKKYGAHWDNNEKKWIILKKFKI